MDVAMRGLREEADAAIFVFNDARFFRIFMQLTNVFIFWKPTGLKLQF